MDLRLTCAPLWHGPADPTCRMTADGVLWRTALTPHGPGTQAVWLAGSGEVRVRAWGPGADWLVDGVPDLLGARDDVTGFDPAHPVPVRVWRAHPGLRIPRTGLVWDALVPAVLEQKVTSVEAWRSWRELVCRFGQSAPGPAPAGMRVLPTPRVLLDLPSWEWHRAGVDLSRRRAIRSAAAVARRLAEAVELEPVAAQARLRAVPGIGPWTAAEVAQRAFGDADAVSVGDYHIPGLVGRVLVGGPLDDEGMLEVLEVYRPHRHRLVRLLRIGAGPAPRRAPRAPIRDYRAL
ncbi:MAG TPA: DNA-3-methyladenine glycosylase 2 family protein [Mycobacteriales bacterium]